jgi:hypothetical protein
MRSAPILRRVSLSYLVSLPEGHPENPNSERPSSGPWSVLCFLHGKYEAAGYCEPNYPGADRQRYGSPEEALRVHGPLEDQSGLPDDNFIVVAPQLPRLEDIWTGQPAQQVEAILDSVTRDFNADRDRVYLTGFSTGADGVYGLYNDSNRPKPTVRWVKLWPVDATKRFTTQRCPPIWLWYGLDQRFRDENKTTVSSLGLKKPGAGPAVGGRLCTDTAMGHAQTATAAYRDRGVYAWLDRDR